jgi:hypothetical protein
MNEKKNANVQFFRGRLPELVKDPILRGKFVVVHELAVKNAFDTFDGALRFALANFPEDEFIIQQVVADSDTVSFLRAAL